MNVYMSRKPILDRGGNVYGYEILYRGDGAENSHKITLSDGTSEEIPDAFFGLDIKTIVGNAKAFINFTNDLLKLRAPLYISPEILVIVIRESQLADEEIRGAVREFKERGYMIALDEINRSDSYGKLFSLADIVKIDMSGSQKSAEETANVCRSSDKLMLAKKVESLSLFENSKKLGCKYMQGYYFMRSAIAAGNSIQPLPVNLMQVMQLMAQPEPDIKNIVDVMSRDAAMCQRILRLINSAYFGIANKVSSINQAILILGLDYLREWVYLMGMQKITRNDNVEAMKLALLLAKFCRCLSELIPEAGGQGESFYLMGLMSMIVFSGERALAQALDEFPLANDIKKGLLRRGGLYGDVFEMAMLYVDGEWDEFDVLSTKYSLSSDEVSDIFVKCMQEIEKLNMA